jgi:hypothetical protein
MHARLQSRSGPTRLALAAILALASTIAVAAASPPALPDEPEPAPMKEVKPPQLPIDCSDPASARHPECRPRPAAPPPPMMAPPPASAPPTAGISGAPARAVLSYFQRGTIKIDTSDAFGFVLLPRRAVTEGEMKAHLRFCRVMFASLDTMEPEDVALTKVLATYWPISTEVSRDALREAFANQDCMQLLYWYDHSVARTIAAKADIQDMSGPLLITWPSEDAQLAHRSDPLIVDFSAANEANLQKVLNYWFRQISQRPEYWTSYIREGTMRAELADAINETAGVMLAVLAGKWESVTAVSDMP